MISKKSLLIFIASLSALMGLVLFIGLVVLPPHAVGTLPTQMVLPSLRASEQHGIAAEPSTTLTDVPLFATDTSVPPTDLPKIVAVLPTAAPTLPPTHTQAPSTAVIVPTAKPMEPLVVPIPQEQVPNQVVIRFDANATQQQRDSYIQSLGGTVSQSIASLDTVIVILPDGVKPLPPAQSAVVKASEPDYFVVALESPMTNDPLYPQQWALPVMNVSNGWDVLPADAPAVIVAVIDSGICTDHADLKGRILPGYDFVENDAQPQDEMGHGCAVAGIIAANTNDGIGIAGVAPNTKIMPLRVLNAQGVGTYSNVAAAITFAADNGAKIVNLSLGGANPSTLLQDAIDYAISKGVMVIAASGNTGGSVLYPAAYGPVIAVGSVDPNLQRSSFSSHGPEIDALAPGRDILTLKRDGTYTTMSGTSFAAPNAAGIAALEMVLGRTLTLDGGVVGVDEELYLSTPTVTSATLAAHTTDISSATATFAATMPEETSIPNGSTQPDYQLYTDPQFGFTVPYPTNWRTEGGGIVDPYAYVWEVSFIGSKDNYEAIIVSVQPLEIFDMSSLEWTASVINGLNQDIGTLQTQDLVQEIIVNGFDAVKVIFPSDETKMVSTFMAVNGYGYRISYITEDISTDKPIDLTYYQLALEQFVLGKLEPSISPLQRETVTNLATADNFQKPLSSSNWIIDFDVHPTVNNGKFSECLQTQWQNLWHAGEDWGTSAGTTVRAIANGQVDWYNPSYISYPGRVVIVKHNLSDGSTMYSAYAHLGSVSVYQGQVISKNDPIGTILNQNTNSHLHWEVRNFADGSSLCNSGASVRIGPGYTYPNRPQSLGYTDPTNYVNAHQGGTNPTCPGPSLNTPSDNQTLNNMNVTFSWSAPSGCQFSGYQLRINDSPDMESSPFYDNGTGNLSETISIGVEWKNRDLWWGVRTANPLSPNWSVRKFRISDVNPPQCSPNADQIALFTDPNYGGSCVTKGIGDYANPGSLGIANDSVSSIKVGSSVQAVLCKDDVYGGGCDTFTGNDSNLSDNGIGDNQVSSAKVQLRPEPCPINADQIALFTDPDYRGGCTVRGVGEYFDSGALGIANDTASSVKVGSNVQVILYNDSGYGSTEETFRGDDPNLSDNAIGDNRVSSAKVQSRCTPNADQAVLFTDANYSGSCVLKGLGDYANPAAMGIANDQVSSIKVGANMQLLLCNNADYAIPCQVLIGQDHDLSDNPIGNDQASSARVQRMADCPITANQVALYSDPNYAAACVVKDIGDYPEPWAMSIAGKTVSSVKVGANVQLVLCNATNYGGPCETLTNDDSMLSNNSIGEDQSLSAKVQLRPTCSAPSLNSPSVDQVFTSQTITFNWSGPSGCGFEGYTFRIKTVANMESGGTIIVDTGNGSTSRTETIPNQWNNQDLYWGVRTANPLSPNWAVRKFRIHPTPAAPTLNAPAHGTTVDRSTSITLTWNASSAATHYYVELWGGPLSQAITPGWITGTSWPIGANWGGTYQWRAKAKNSSGESPWSETRTFTVKIGSPNIVSVTSSQTQIGFGWDASADAPGNITGYRIYRDNDLVTTVAHPITLFSDSGLECGHQYEYRVTAYKGNNESDPSVKLISTEECPADFEGGLVGEYYNNIDLTGLALVRRDAAVNFEWQEGSPSSAISSPDTFSVRWTGQVQPRYTETYTFSVFSDDGARLWVNGQLLVDAWYDHVGDVSGIISLVEGQRYDIKLEYYENGGGAAVRLNWSSLSQGYEIIPQSQLYPGSGTGLTGDYYDEMDFTAPVLSRLDRTIDFTWAYETPHTAMDSEWFAVRWTGQIQPLFSETYTFYTVSDDGVRLWINGQLVIDNWTYHPATEDSGTIVLTRGQKYDIKLEYFESVYEAVIQLKWSSASQAKQIVPQSQLYPYVKPPTDLSATVASISQINLAWTDNSDNETNFRIERSPNGLNSWVEIAQLAANTTTYQNTGLACDTTYHYRVRAFRTTGGQYSAFSNSGSAVTPPCPPKPPTLVEPSDNVALGNKAVHFSWQTSNSNGQTGYVLRISQSINPQTAPWLLNTTLNNDQQVYDYTFDNDGKYYWHIQTTGTGGSSQWVTQSLIIDTTKPTGEIVEPPDNSYVNTNQILIRVIANDSGSGVCSVAFINGYDKELGAAGLNEADQLSVNERPTPPPMTAEDALQAASDEVSAQAWDWHFIAGDSNGSDGWSFLWPVTDVPDQAIAFFVYINDCAGNSSSDVNWTVTLDRAAPTSSVDALPASSPTLFAVNWTGTDATSGISSYDVQYQDNNGLWTNWQTNVTTTTASFTGIAGHTYRFRSRARDRAGNVEAWPVSADTQTMVVVPLTPPTLLKPSESAFLNTRSVSFAWQSAGTPGQTGYRLRLSQSVNPDTSPWLVNAALTNLTLAYNYTFPSDGVFYWHLQTLASNGSSSWVTRSFVVDTVVPTGSVISPPANSYITTNVIDIIGSASDVGSGVQCAQFLLGYDPALSAQSVDASTLVTPPQPATSKDDMSSVTPDVGAQSWGWNEIGWDCDGSNGWQKSLDAQDISDQNIAVWIFFYDFAWNYVGVSNGNILLDRTAPSSTVKPLPSSSATSFNVSWSGTDATSQIANYDVQYQDNNGSWIDWQTNVTTTSATFTGVTGHTYGFRSRARDLAGNVEEWPATPDASTTIAVDTPLNDLFLNAHAVSALPFAYTQDINNSAVSITDPNMCAYNRTNTVWFSYTSALKQTVNFNTEGSGYDTVIGVYTGSEGNLTEIGCDDDGGTGFMSSLTLSLNANTPYLIVVAKYGPTPVSSTTMLTFSVQSTAVPAAPLLVSPNKGVVTNETSPTFTWNAVANASLYEIQIDNTATFASPEQTAVVSGLSYNATPISNGLTHWRVRALNSLSMPGAWSPAWSLTIDTVSPLTPVLTAPANGASSTNNRPIFSWKPAASAVRYEVQLSTNNPPDVMVASVPVLPRVLPSYVSPSPLVLATYYWRVRTIDVAGNYSPWSETWQVSITSPANSAPSRNRFETSLATLTWGAVTWATGYEIQVDNNSNFSSPEYGSGVLPAGTLSHTTTALPNGLWYWRVRARRADGSWGLWSPSDSFIVEGP